MEHGINWTKAIEKNRAALASVIEELFALLEFALSGAVKNLPREAHLAAGRILRPAEAALRRLIIIMAREVRVKLPPPRPMPRGLVIAATGEALPRFKLYDARKRLRPRAAMTPEPKGGPRIHFFSARGPLVPTVLTQRSMDNAASLCRRFAALKRAFETLPDQVLRMARWRQRRAQKQNVKFKSPLRPGPPPGNHKRPRHEIDLVLRDVHGLAFEALRVNSS